MICPDAIESLARLGWARIPDFLTPELRAALAADAGAASSAPAGVGRDGDHVQNIAVRKASIAWLDGGTPAQVALLALAEDGRIALNRALMLGLFSFEACYALYPDGGFYARHRDSFPGARNRVVSLVCYLHPEWRPEWGGALRVHPADSESADLTPAPGSAVLLLSEELAHEVLPTLHPRLALTGWWRVNTGAAPH